MQTIDVVLNVINKVTVAQVWYLRRGPKGYGLLLIFRLLAYSVLKEIFTTRRLVKHLRKNPHVLMKFGFKKMPCRRTIDSWFVKYDSVLDRLIKIVGDTYLQLNESEWTILDSTPIRDRDDPDAKKGYSSQGPFWGFKLHASCDEYCVPLRATFTTGNIHDSQEAFMLLTPTRKIGGDSAYDFEDLKIEVVDQKSRGYFVHNPRREKMINKKPTPKILKKVRIKVEQCNSILKEQVLQRTWTKVKGFHKKATRCLLAVLALQSLAIYNLKKFGYPSVRIGDLRA
jgi:hypothetical protein